MTTEPTTSESLLIRVRDPSDREAWNRFDAIYRPVIYRLARRARWQHNDANDLVQQVMLSVSKAIPNWEKDPNRGTFRSWLHRVARNALISSIRGQRAMQFVDETTDMGCAALQESTPDELDLWIEQEYCRSRIRWAAEQVRDEFTNTSWRAFWMTTLDEASVIDTAEQLKISIGSVYAARSRIMRRLQEIARDEASIERNPHCE